MEKRVWHRGCFSPLLFLFSSSDKCDSCIWPWLSQMRNINIRYVSWVWFYVLEAVNIFSHREVILPSPTLMCLYFNPLLGLNSLREIWSVDEDPHLFLSQQVWTPTWFLAGSWSLTLAAAAPSRGWLDMSLWSSAQPPGRTRPMALPRSAPCLRTAWRYKCPTPWENEQASTVMCGRNYISGIVFHCMSKLP